MDTTERPELHIVHGLDLSYFTGKVEAYLRAKGIVYVLQEMDTASFRRCGRATGILQMPQIECPDGSWLTDSTLIIRHFEQTMPEPAITPADPAMRFISHLIEDFGDESLWRPALYYRWVFADDARLMSTRLARGMLRDLPFPFFVRRQMILRRQQSEYLKKDGVTAHNKETIETHYKYSLQVIEEVLEHQDFVLGDRPTDADFGLFGPMFRHFFSDPTPAKIMRDFAPRTMAWVARLWALTPEQFSGKPAITSLSVSSQELLMLVRWLYFPYMSANAAALAAGNRRVKVEDRGVEFDTPVSPYRAWCFDEIQREFQSLDEPAQKIVEEWMKDHHTIEQLKAPRHKLTFRAPELPIKSKLGSKTLDRKWI